MTTTEYEVFTPEDFTKLESLICKELKVTPQSCAFMRSAAFVKLRIHALYRDPSQRPHDLLVESPCGVVSIRLIQRSHIVQIHSTRALCTAEGEDDEIHTAIRDRRKKEVITSSSSSTSRHREGRPWQPAH